MPSEGLRYEILVNGERRCIAGTVGQGSLEAGLMRARFPASDDEPVERAHLLVHGSQRDANQYVRWLNEQLGPGDEVTIRILDAGDSDPPPHVADSER